MTRKETTWVPNFCPSCGGKFPEEHKFCGRCGFRREPLQLHLPARNLDPWRWVVGVFFLLAAIAWGVIAISTILNIPAPYSTGDVVLAGFFFLAGGGIMAGLFAYAWHLIDKAEKAPRV